MVGFSLISDEYSIKTKYGYTLNCSSTNNLIDFNYYIGELLIRIKPRKTL
jgi:hypothetical protein